MDYCLVRIALRIETFRLSHRSETHVYETHGEALYLACIDTSIRLLTDLHRLIYQDIFGAVHLYLLLFPDYQLRF